MKTPDLVFVWRGGPILRISFFLTLFAMSVPGLYFPGSATAQNKQLPKAIVAPVTSIGPVREAERAIIFNSLEEHLAARFQTVSQEEYQVVEQWALGQLGLAQCTGDRCIRKTMELLQAEWFFALQLTRDGDFSQISLTVVTAEEKTKRNATCTACNIGLLNTKVAGLVEGLLGTASVFSRLPSPRAGSGTQGNPAIAATAGSIPTPRAGQLPAPDPVREFPRVTFFVAPILFDVTLSQGTGILAGLEDVTAFGWAVGTDFWFQENLALQFFLGAAPQTAIVGVEVNTPAGGGVAQIAAHLNYFSYQFGEGKTYYYAGAGFHFSNWEYLDFALAVSGMDISFGFGKEYPGGLVLEFMAGGGLSNSFSGTRVDYFDGLGTPVTVASDIFFGLKTGYQF